MKPRSQAAVVTAAMATLHARRHTRAMNPALLLRRAGLASLLAVTLAACSTTAEPMAHAAPPAVQLEATAVHHVDVTATQRRYPVWVSLPPSYAQQPERHYPVLYTTDAPWSFPMLVGIRNLMGRGSNRFAEFILVGLPPQDGLSLRDSRSRDYTPTNPRLRAGFDPSDYEAPDYGQADAWRQVIAGQVIPLVEATYRTDPARRVYAGHSYGGLFGAHMLMTQPTLFSTYILGSPSLWFDQGEIFRIEEQVAERRAAQADTALPARVRMYIGSWERPGEETRSYGPEGKDMVADVARFEAVLRSRGYSGLDISHRVIDGQDHGSVYPAFITDALVWALPGSNPKYQDH